MARKLASVVEIATCDSIPDSDRLSVATMVGKGWKVVVGRDEFKPGDKCVYFEIDSFLDPLDERYAFLRERCLKKFVSKSGSLLAQGLRIKSMRLRGVVSQGLVMPLDKFPEIKDRIVHKIVGETRTEMFVNPQHRDGELLEQDLIGADVSSLLKVDHYDDVKERLQPMSGNPISADAMCGFPSAFVPKTDECRIQNIADWFETMKGRKWQVSCKHDGTSCTIAYSKQIDEQNPEVVCSRNLRLKPVSGDGKVSVYWQMANQYDVMSKLKSLAEDNGIEYAVQGEIVGPGINKCRNKEQKYKFLVFRIYDITNQRWVNPTETVKMCESLGLEHVQIIKDNFAFFDEVRTMDEALKFAEGKTAEGNEREGVVLKTVDDLPYASCKIVSNRYLLKGND